MDAAHPELRFVSPGASQLLASEQIRAALNAVSQTSPIRGGTSVDPPQGVRPVSDLAHHAIVAESFGPAVQEILIPEDPHRSTIVLFQATSGLPHPVFVDAYRARVLGSLSTSAWLPGITRALHSGWPLGDPGSWLLETGAGWATVMLVTGLYLWWPRDRGFLGGLWPRVHRGWRVLIRDLHSCVAAWFSIVFLFFLISALPWTAFWGGQVLARIESFTGQTSPAGFSPGGASLSQVADALSSVDALVEGARRRGVRGTLAGPLARSTALRHQRARGGGGIEQSA